MPDMEKIKKKISTDPFARMLGVRFDELGEGYVKLSMQVRDDMLNFNGSMHGGVIFSLADIAFSAASNSHGTVAVALHADITYLKAVPPGSTLVATGVEKNKTRRTGLYSITIDDADGNHIAVFQGVVYRIDQPLF
ncbi:MAG: Acyl-coenzyme A thioesterase PaaI [Pelotomaculum sp. PtaB.Bin013]|uniref:Hotdog fold thioesterase n=1 Tax=Pelotomaculum isophthalicicum JI TaxID=947010 RepID=A0A9X4JV56_9FIRM|nr:hotdog fold thioesterase [Pelotomaculum isophthalicicum]MDF9407706.1 hotdog fold thioesterase [Pelotomaculum isophthalicicum JI]OPX86428.1 MAG: Acyl-coenzyme A thioesterase PaaI [Pelotomaculum sp. PtaB.Bin013]